MKHYISLQAFFSYIGRSKLVFFSIAALYATANLLLAIIPWATGQLTQSLVRHDDNLMFWTSIVIAASIVHDIFWRSSEFAFLKLIVVRSHRFDDVIFGAVMQHNYSFFVDKFTGKISSYTTALGRDFRELLDNAYNQYIAIPTYLPVIAVTMFAVNTYTGIIFVTSLILMYIIGRKLARTAANAERIEADERSTIDGQVVDAVANFVSIKAFGNERREAQRLYRMRQHVINAATHSYARTMLFWGAMGLFVRWVLWPSTFLVNIYLYNHSRIDLAQMTTFVAAIVLFTNYIWEVVWSISRLNIKLAGMEEAYRYLFDGRNVFKNTDEPEQSPPPTFADSLALIDVNFAYPDKTDTRVLNDVSLTVKRGEKIGIVGPSGGGKSTLLKLLLGYYPIPAKELLVDGQPTDNRSLTDLTAYVPQDTTIFHRSIRDNIAYAKPNASEAEIIAAAKHAQAHEFITKLDEGYNTLVGERGIKLSGGQRQRIAIARAILKDAPILLLDEATSALDSESEKLIQKALLDLLDDRTALVIAHRLSTIQHMDRILVFDDGRVVEQGNHQQLLANKGLYARLWSHQTDGFIQD